MKKIINLILVISLSCILFKILFILNANENSLKYHYDEIKLLINRSDVKIALETFGQFDEYFSDVYIDSTEIYQLQNSLKLHPEESFDFHLDIISCNDFKSLLELLEHKFDNSFMRTKYEKQIFENIMTVILEYFSGYDLKYDIGYDLLSSFNEKIKSENYNDYAELNMVLKHKARHDRSEFYNEIFNVITDVDNEMLNILQINVHSKFTFNMLKDYSKHNSINIDLNFNEYHYGFSNTLNELKETNEILNKNFIRNGEPTIYIESILNFVPYNNSLFGDRFKKIKRYSRQKENEQIKSTLSNQDIINIFNSYKYYIKEINNSNNNIDNYVYKKDILELLNKIILELSKKENVAKAIHMQDEFYKTKKNYSKYFYSLEPITLEYLNSSVKKEFIYNDYFISKIFLQKPSDKYFTFINKAFNEKTTIQLSNRSYFISFMVILLLLLLNNFKLIFKNSKK